MKRKQDSESELKKCMELKIICCLCAKLGDESHLIHIFSTKGTKDKLYEKVMDYTPFKVNTKSDMKQYICNTCTSKINHWHTFIQSCIEAQKKMHLISENDYFQSNTKLRSADTTCNNTSYKSTPPQEEEEKLNNNNNKHELDVPDTFVETLSEFQNVTHLSKTKIFSQIKCKQTTSFIAKSNLKNDTKESLLNETTTALSPSKRFCNEPKTGGTYCIARWCGNNAKKNPGISLFRIPKDLDRALLWLTNAEREDLKILSMQVLHTKYLCMEHFTDDMFMNSNKKKLVWNALPTHFPKPDYAYRKEFHVKSDQQHQSDAPGISRQIILPRIHQPIRRRPLRPKPLTVEPKGGLELNDGLSIGDGEDVKNQSLTASTINSANNSCLNKKEEPSVSEIRLNGLKLQGSDRSIVPKSQTVTSHLLLQGSRSQTVPTANIIICSNVSDIIDLKEDKTQTAAGTCEYLSVTNTDYVECEDNQGDSSTAGDKKNVSSENETMMNEEMYFSCDAESLCLGNAFRETNERIYQCRYCGEMFLVKSNLILHQTTYHSDHPVGCELCGKVLYKSRSEFMEHVCEHYSDNVKS
ncbi:uncharacterized protein [Periplaneta americana]|uniref:uncharacterized protein n=1 Tax=Periplaneta americana TaxID=6978 RepID=UPI0037E83CCE